MRTLVIANGKFGTSIDVVFYAKNTDLIIAADGGADHVLAADIIPDVVIGDLDSISTDGLKRLALEEKKIIRYPAEKDYTDLELALRYAVDHGASEIYVLGALGARWDMSVANLMLLGADFLKNAMVRLITETGQTIILRGGHNVEVNGAPGDIISLIPLADDAVGVTTTGLRYALNDETLFFSATRGVSNELILSKAIIHLVSGILVCIHQPKKGFLENSL